MKHQLFTYLLLFTSLFCFGQQDNIPKNSPGPWALHFTFEPIIGETVPGLHSFAYATYGSKWLFVGGRTNGLHGLNSNSNFETEFANTRIVVVDTIDWQWTSATVTQLPQHIADPLSSTNMQYWAKDSMLYMVGGYGWDSTAEEFTTYPTLTAINVAGIINSVETGDSLRPHIRQYVDTNLAVCGGELIQMDSLYYLVMGHKFEGRYSTPQQMLFTQRYTNAIRKFKIEDDGVNLTISNFSEEVDTNNFHRRDLNAVRLDFADSSRIAVMGGVFQKNKDLPFYTPVYVKGNQTLTDTSAWLSQKFNQYTCAHVVVNDDIPFPYGYQAVYTLGGMGTSYYNDTTATVVYDSLVPFSKTISMAMFEQVGPIGNYNPYEGETPGSFGLLPGLLGANAIFIKGSGLTATANKSILLSELPNDLLLPRKFIGYFFGGIRGTKANFGVSSANDSIYRVYVKSFDFEGGTNEIPGLSQVAVFPNPGNGNAMLNLKLDKPAEVSVSLVSLSGAVLQTLHKGQLQQGQQNIVLGLEQYAQGLYFIKVETPQGQLFLKYALVK